MRRVAIRARILADDELLGAYRSVFRGGGLEFEEVREYEEGDDVRSIDWNVTARMGAPYVKKYREERELNILVAVDVSASTWFGTAERSKRELAVDVAALLAVAALLNNDRVGLLLFTDKVERFVPPKQGREHLFRIVGELVEAEAGRAPTRIAAAARFLRNMLKKRSVVFVISDFLDSGFEAPLRELGRRHDVIAITLSDPREEELPAVGVVALEDAETGRLAYIDTADRRVRDAYASAARERRGERIRAFGRMMVDAVDLSTDRPHAPPLMGFFAARARRP